MPLINKKYVREIIIETFLFLHMSELHLFCQELIVVYPLQDSQFD